MKTETIYSPIKDNNISGNIENSPIWNSAHTEEEYRSIKDAYLSWFRYTIKFDGLTPVQVTNIEAI